MNRSLTDGKRFHILGRLSALGAVLALAGCVGPFAKNDYLAFEAPPEQLHDIEEVSLNDRSRTEPVSVEDATEEVIRAVVKAAEPPAKMEISLEEVRAAALAHNLDLVVELLSPTIAQASVDEEEAKFESTFTGSIRRSRFDSPTALGTEGTRATSNNVDLGVRIPLRTGGTATVSFPFNKSETNNPFSLLNPAYSADLAFSISQPLLRNGWSAPTPIPSAWSSTRSRSPTPAPSWRPSGFSPTRTVPTGGYTRQSANWNCDSSSTSLP